jgi:pectate lyase-like protein
MRLYVRTLLNVTRGCQHIRNEPPRKRRMLGNVSRRGFLAASIAAGSSAKGVAAERPGSGRAAMAAVRDLGVVGDGRTNDTRALQRAIDLAHEQGGRVVQFSAGTWLSVDPTGVQGLFGVARR